VPVKNLDYGPPIDLQLSYNSGDQRHNPAFGHAPGDTTTFSEDILVGYVVPFDDTMDGSTPSLSSVIALNQPLTANDTFCWVSPPPTTFSTFPVGTEFEVEFHLFASGGCPNTGKSLRDKNAQLSIYDEDTGEFVSLPNGEGGTKFHFNENEKVNERDVDTQGLLPGRYLITIFSDKFSPQTREFSLQP
jgi:hypothetical protein